MDFSNLGGNINGDWIISFVRGGAIFGYPMVLVDFEERRLFMEWFEAVMEPEVFEQTERQQEIYLMLCMLSDKNTGESRINEFLFVLQQKLNEISAQGAVLFRKAFIYGDTRVCVKEFSKTKESEIYYLDTCAKPVQDSHILLIADAFLERFLEEKTAEGVYPAPTVWQIWVRESAYGFCFADEAIVSNYYGEQKVLGNLLLVSDSIQNDWLEKFAKKQNGKVFSFEDVDKLVEHIWS